MDTKNQSNMDGKGVDRESRARLVVLRIFAVIITALLVGVFTAHLISEDAESSANAARKPAVMKQLKGWESFPSAADYVWPTNGSASIYKGLDGHQLMLIEDVPEGQSPVVTVTRPCAVYGNYGFGGELTFFDKGKPITIAGDGVYIGLLDKDDKVTHVIRVGYFWQEKAFTLN
jgi:hypothetical protein